MAAYLFPIWENYREHCSLDLLRDDILTYPWYEPPKTVDESLLRRAIEMTDLGATKLLLSMGESPQLPASSGFSFLHIAVDMVADAAVGLERDGDESRPRQNAALAILTALLDAGADPNVLGQDGTPLHRAAGSGVIESAHILLSYEANIEARMLTDGELTPLMHAALMDHAQMVKYLVESGANRSAMSRTSLTDPPMTLRELLRKENAAHADEILAILGN